MRAGLTSLCRSIALAEADSAKLPLSDCSPADVVFVDLPFNSYELGHRFKSAWSYKQSISPYEVHLGYRYMAANLLAHGYRAEIVYPSPNSGLTKARLARHVCAAQPRLVGLTSYEGSLRESIDFIARLKSLGLLAVICMGGHLATFSCEDVFRFGRGLIDVVVLGEGEHTIVDLIRAIKNGQDLAAVPGIAFLSDGGLIRTAPRAPEQEIDSFPFPVVYGSGHQNNDQAPLFLTTSRGCYGRCSFCRSSSLSQSWRPRTPTNIVDEIERAVAMGVTTLEFVDDNFLGPGQRGKIRALTVANEIRRRNLKIQFHMSCRVNDVDEPTVIALREAGLISVSLGVESGVKRILDTFRKGITPDQSIMALRVLERLGIPTLVYVIFFDPFTTLDEAGENARFLQYIRSIATVRFEELVFRRLIPISGTELFERIKRDGLLRGDSACGYRFVFREPRVSWLADFLEEIDLRFEAVMQRTEFEPLRGLYDLKEAVQFSFIGNAIAVLSAHAWKKRDAVRAMREILGDQLRHLVVQPAGAQPVNSKSKEK